MNNCGVQPNVSSVLSPQLGLYVMVYSEIHSKVTENESYWLWWSQCPLYIPGRHICHSSRRNTCDVCLWFPYLLVKVFVFFLCLLLLKWSDWFFLTHPGRYRSKIKTKDTICSSPTHLNVNLPLEIRVRPVLHPTHSHTKGLRLNPSVPLAIQRYVKQLRWQMSVQ